MPGTGKVVVLLGAIAIIAAGQIHAQDSGAMASCGDIDEADARLACYDAAIGRGASAQSDADTAEIEPLPAATRSEPEPLTQPPQSDPQPATAAPSSGPQPLTEEVGKEQLSGKSRPDQEPESFRGRVVDCKQDASKKWYFYFDNGQVWKQRANARLSNRDCDFEVTITKDSFGYKMQIVGEGKKIRVGRIR
ncbi:MAG: hypothetical protein QNI96_00330 [Woeseiaceae bacterium]|nr:hypothetical protein [Woeseiaceae bacterium]